MLKHKPGSVKELILVMKDKNNEDVDEDGCVAIDHPSENKGKIKCVYGQVNRYLF